MEAYRAERRGSPPVILFVLLILLVLFAAVVGAATVLGLDLDLRPGFGGAHTSGDPLRLTPVLSNPWSPMVGADGSVSSRVPLLPGDMPDFPDCSSLGVVCDRWDVQIRDSADGGRIVDVRLLSSKGQEIGHTQVLRVQTGTLEELHPVAQTGKPIAWIGHVKVAQGLTGNGLGNLMWRAGDMALRIVAGSGTVRVVYDTVGWGEALMRHIPESWFIIKQAPLWVYTLP